MTHVPPVHRIDTPLGKVSRLGLDRARIRKSVATVLTLLDGVSYWWQLEGHNHNSGVRHL